METDITTIEPLKRLAKDIREAGKTLSDSEARFLVDLYYQIQGNRVGTGNQESAMDRMLGCPACGWHGVKTNLKSHDEKCDEEVGPAPEPHATVSFFTAQLYTVERQIKSILDAYSMTQPLGQWARSVHGVGPVLAAGLLAHINIRKAQTASAVWRFAGLDPTSKWAKGQKRPWNAALKVVCWKLGESFVKVSGNEKSVYGALYVAKKAEEIRRNEAGLLASEAARALAEKDFRRDTKAKACYEAGTLPPGHLHARAERYAAKIFLSHYWQRGRELAGLPVPEPYAIAHLNHAHKIEPE